MRLPLVAVALLLPILAACGSSPTRSIVSLAASEGLNPNSENQPSPLIVRVYELKSIDTFNQLQFFDLLDQDTTRLGGDLLNRREIEIAPGRRLTIEREADPQARFVGVIAGYRSLENIAWRGSFPLEPGTRNRIAVTLDPLSLSVGPMPDSGFLGLF